MAQEDDNKGHDETITVVVNGTPHEVPKKDELTYVEVVTHAYPDYPQNPGATYSVTYTRGHNDRDGILSPGGTVKAKDGMAFRVNRTSES
ncbi:MULTISPECIES: multiubiquitin domain-containing protein [unclassified Mesorhizobium]|uniref:multiubiquitin domain-containing protein n=1 Tax=unclassified Mesorhizobium TaxID=325217 RepID=UPI0003FC86DE|nr:MULTISPECIES: multiubiquitin domain-containing protein [unclassified Mesorhizobium]